MDKGQALLERFGATDIKFYSLINNYGYTFRLDGVKHDIRFWANSYGCHIGKWSGGGKEIDEAFNKEIGEGSVFDWGED